MASIGLLAINAQPGFNLASGVGYDKNHARNMVVLNDTIVAYGMGFDAPVNGNQGVILAQFDSSGNLLNSNIVLDPLGEPLSIDKPWGTIAAGHDGGYVMTASTVGRKSSFLIKTNKNLDVEFMKEYPDTINLSNFSYSLVNSVNGYILYGFIQNANFVLRPFVTRVDPYGEIIWNQYFGNPSNSGFIGDLEPINDTLFVAGGYEAVSPFIGDDYKSIVRVININGEVVKEWESEMNPEVGQLIELEVLENDYILCHGVATIGEANGLDIVRPTLFVLDDNMNLLWVKNYGRSGVLNSERWFRDMQPTHDGHYIAAGESHIKMGNREVAAGWLMKFSTEGDSIWSRYELPEFDVDSLVGDNYFAGAGVLSSGNIIAGGTAALWDEEVIWLVKVTTDGCMEVIDCGLVPTFSTPQPDHALSLHLSPNPTNGHFKATWGMTENAVLRLYDLQGQLLKKKRVGKEETEALFDTGGLPTGVYIMEIRDGQGRFDREKLLILE